MIWKSTSGALALLDRPIAFHRVFVDLTGSVTAALLLSQAVYWQRRTGDGWWYKTREDWCDETGMSPKELDNARRTLRRHGWWHEARRGVPARVWYRVDLHELMAALDELEASDRPKGATSFAQRGRPVSPKGSDQFRPKGESGFAQRENPYKETKTEIKTEIKQRESLPSSSSSYRTGETLSPREESGGRADARAAAAAGTDDQIELTKLVDEPPDDAGLRPDGLEPRLLRELADRCAMLGCPTSRVERTVAGWLASLPPGLVNAAVAKALVRAHADPLAYAHRVVAAAMVDLAVRRERAARDEEIPPWLQGCFEALHDGDEEDRNHLPC